MAAFEVIALDTATPRLRAPGSSDQYTFPRAITGTSNTIEQRNSTSAQTFNVYNTYTDASNYERGFARWSGSVFQIGTEAAGTGTVRNINFVGGKVGINTPSFSTYALDVKGTVRFGQTSVADGSVAIAGLINLTPNQSGQVGFNFTNSTANGAEIISLINSGTGGQRYDLIAGGNTWTGGGGTGPLESTFAVQNMTANKIAFVINASGDVGIGGNISSNAMASSTLTALAAGRVGIGQNSPTAVLHLKAGTATANTAPFKLTPGVNLTVPENGTLEYDGTNLYFTTGGTRKTVTLV